MDPEVSLVDQADAAYTRVRTDPARYAGQAEDCVRRARSAGDVEALVAGLRAEAWARHAVLDNDGARRLLDHGVRLARRHGYGRRLGDLLVTRAVALHELGRYDAAARDLRRAEPLVAGPDRPELLFQLAVLDHNRGRVRSAARTYRELLDDPGCPPLVWVKAANNLAHAQTLLGRPHEALGHLDRAAELAAGLGPLLPAVIASTRAWAAFHAGRLADSVRRFEEAGRLHAAAGLPLGEHHQEYADVLRDLRLLDEATAAARSAAAEFDRHGARLMAAEARLRCAGLALDRGDAAAARADAEAAARDFRQQRRPAWAARAVITAAEAGAAETGYTPDGLRRLTRAAADLRRLGLRGEAAYGHLAAGRAALALHRAAIARRELTLAGDLAPGRSLLVRLRGHLARALLADAEGSPDVVRECARGLRDLARHRDALPSLELRVRAAGHGTELGALGLRRLLPVARPDRILTWLERTRAAGLMRVQPPAAGVDPDVIALRAVQHELREARLGRGEEPPELLARQSALEARIRRRAWTADSSDGPAAGVAGVAGLRRALGGAWLAEYAVIDDRVLAVVVEPRRIRVAELGPPAPVRAEIDALGFALRRLLGGTVFTAAATAAARSALDRLAGLLVRPLGVPGDVPLVVVPSGRLLGVPWSPLHPAPVSLAPSATLWARRAAADPAAPASPAPASPAPAPPALAPPGRAAADRAAADRAAADRAAGGGAGGIVAVAGPDLDGAPAEIRAVAAGHAGSRTLVPPESTVDATVELIRDAELAHLACHGRFRTDSPLFSALELSDGRLTVYEMLSRGVAPHRVVLASCHSGTQQPYDGDEVLGFVGAMMSSGTAGIVAAELPVPDGACADAMTVLHGRIRRGDPLATAVWHARAALAGGGPAEFIAWCGLAAYGPA